MRAYLTDTINIFRFFFLLFSMLLLNNRNAVKGEVQSRITIISKERVKISLQIGAKIMKIG